MQPSFYLATCLLFLSPSLQPAIYNPVDIPWYSEPCIALLFAIFFFFKLQRQNIEIHSLFLTLLLLGASPILLNFSFFDQQLFYMAFIMALMALATVGYNLNERQIIQLFHAFILAAYIWALTALIVWLGFTHGEVLSLGDWALSTAKGIKINGPFANGNVFALMMLCAWVISLWFWLTNKHMLKNIWLLHITFFWMMAFLALARGAWLAHLLPLLIVLMISYKRKDWNRIVLLGASGSVAIFISIGVNHMQGGALQFKQQINGMNAVGQRPLLYASIYEIWRDNQWEGVGYGKIQKHYLTAQAEVSERYDFHMAGLDMTTYGHNTVLHLMAEAGVLGIIISALVMYFLLFFFLKKSLCLESIMWPVIMILCMLWIQSLINITLTRPFPMLFFALIFGVALKSIAWRKGLIIKVPRKAIILPIFFAVFVLSSLAVTETTAWKNFTYWYTTDDMVIKKELLHPLLENHTTMPFVVSATGQDMLSRGLMGTYGAGLLPEIKKALEIHESKILYISLFFSQVSSENLEAACATGEFIIQQHWENDVNEHFYHAACNGKLDVNTFQVYE